MSSERTAALVALVWSETLRPPLLGLEPPIALETARVAPNAQAIAFFRELEEKGNRGPLLQVPDALHMAPGIVLSLYHGRRTSHCWSSFTPPEVAAALDLVQRLPDAETLRAARELGFTTLVVDGEAEQRAYAPFARAHEGGLLRHLHGDGRRSAWEIRALSAPGSAPPGARAGASRRRRGRGRGGGAAARAGRRACAGASPGRPLRA